MMLRDMMETQADRIRDYRGDKAIGRDALARRVNLAYYGEGTTATIVTSSTIRNHINGTSDTVRPGKERWLVVVALLFELSEEEADRLLASKGCPPLRHLRDQMCEERDHQRIWSKAWLPPTPDPKVAHSHHSSISALGPDDERRDEGSRPAPGLPAIFGHLPTSIWFEGRSALGLEIETRFAALEAQNAPSAPVVVLHGPAGIGKSTAAAAWLNGHRSEVDHAWWIDADHPDRVRTLLAELAASADGGLSVDAPSARIARALVGRRWRLVLDNVEDWTVLELLPQRCALGRVLVTTRIGRGWDNAIPVEPLADDVVGAWATKVTDASADDVANLLRVTEGYPLFVDVLLKYVGRNLVSLRELLGEVEANPLRPVIQTLVQLLADVSPAGASFLRCAAVLAPVAVPRPLYRALGTVCSQDPALLGTVRASGLVEVEELSGSSLRLHRQIRDVLLDIPEVDQVVALGRALAALRQVVPVGRTVVPSELALIAALMPHGAEALGRLRKSVSGDLPREVAHDAAVVSATLCAHRHRMEPGFADPTDAEWALALLQSIGPGDTGRLSGRPGGATHPEAGRAQGTSE